MTRGLVLMIEDDEWVSSLLSGAIRDAGYDVLICNTARAGLDTACDKEPDCIICDIDLPDHDGYWVARNVRTQPSRVAVTPFLFLSSLDDQEARLEGFHVGADAYMTKPFRVDEVVAQVAALVQMASRLRKRRDSLVSVPPSSPAVETTAIQGDLSQMSIATVFTVLELERRTGLVEVVSKKRRVTVEVASGWIVTGTIGGTKADAITLLRTILAWKVGRFSFTPQADRSPPDGALPIGHLLLEAVRLEDESVRDGNEPVNSSRRAPSTRLSAPSMGGPPSRQADLGPPSSRAFRPPPAALPKEVVRPVATAKPVEEKPAPDRQAYYDWADFGADEPAPAPQESTGPYDGPTSGDLIPESSYAKEAAKEAPAPEDLLTEMSSDQLDDVDEEPALSQLLEEDLASERPNALHRPPGARPPQKPVGPPLRPGAMSGTYSPRLPGGAPMTRTSMGPGLPGPPPRQPAQARGPGQLPGPPPRTGSTTNRLPGPPPGKGPVKSPSGEYNRPVTGPQPSPRAWPQQTPQKSMPPPLPNAGVAQRTGPVPPQAPKTGIDPGTGPIPQRGSPPPPLPRAPSVTKPDLSESGVRHAPPPLPPKQPAAPRTPTSPEIGEKKR